MFDTNKVANNIKNARTKMNMTQMNLADEMSVSYQAVSNWERGNSMPDISKLPELCKILNISFEELVGERIPETDTVEKMLQDENADVTLEEMAQIGQLVKPEKIENKVNETVEKEGNIPFSVLVNLAPFMDKEILGKLAEKIIDIDVSKLFAITPFLDKKSMDILIDKLLQTDGVNVNKIVGLAPFLSKTTLEKIAEYLVRHGQANKIVALAPFMGNSMFSGLLNGTYIDMGSKKEGKPTDVFCNLNDDLDNLDEEDIAKLAFEALEQGSEVVQYLDYMDEDDVANLAVRALEMDKDTEIFLDYMDEDDVEKLAFKAFETGKPIECYLDHMDEDAIKKLLLKSIKK